MEGTVRSINTSPVPEIDEQAEEAIVPGVKLPVGTTQADTQEETLQPESSEPEDTSVKRVDSSRGKNIGPTAVLTTSDTDDIQVQHLHHAQKEDKGTTPDNDGEDYISDGQEVDTAVQDDQMSRASQDDNYCTAISNDDLDDTVQFGNPFTQPFLSRSVRVPTTEVGCLSFTQMFQEYLQVYPLLTQAEAFITIKQMAQRLDMYLNRYPAQHINCMTSDSEFVAFVNHAIQLALDLMAYPTICAVF